MPTLQELTLAHSQRLSEVHRTRDERLAKAHTERDGRLQELPGAVKHLQKYREELAEARTRQLTGDSRAGAMRVTSLTDASVHRSDVLDDAHRSRIEADLGALDARRRDEQDADAKYSEAIERARMQPDAQRSRAIQDADRERRKGREDARRGHDEALTSAQQQYRGSVEDAITKERRQGRDTDRAYYDALRLGDAAVRAATAAAEQNLLASLIGLEGAAEILRTWRLQVATINIEAARAEQEEFSRFRHELAETTSR
jgi:hypothetical protein